MKLQKQNIKAYVAIATLLLSATAIFNERNLHSNLALVSKDKSQIKYVAGSEVTEIINNDGEEVQEENKIQRDEKTAFNTDEKINLQLIDKASPNNIEAINTKVLEDNMIINFEKPEDNGTNYEYIIKNNDEEKKMKFYAKTDIKGYGYNVDSNEGNQANQSINKFDDGSILVENLNWDSDYYLHIRTFDENDNSSDSKTFKLDLPSGGVRIQYIDINSNSEIIPLHMINGNAKESYNTSSLEKTIDGYRLIKTEGETSGRLTKDRINVTYKYAKKATSRINYINRDTGEEISNPEIIDGFEGMEINISAKEIYGYKCESSNKVVKMKNGENVINLYYEEIPKGNVTIKYLDRDTNSEISEDINITNYIGESFETKAKEVDGYELDQSEEIFDGIINENQSEIIYYYKKKKEEVTNEMNEYSGKYDTIVDELLENLEGIEEPTRTAIPKTISKSEKILTEYQIIMDCDDSDYIIYYKSNQM